MKKIVAYVVRHADTDLNNENKFRGDLDIPINDTGKQQAKEVAEFFRGRSFNGMYGSTRKRVRQTLEPLMEQTGIEMKPMEALDSLDTGDFAGEPKSIENLKELKWYREHPEKTIPGGEKVANFRDRVDSKLIDLIHRGESGDKPVLIGAHGSIIKEIGRLLNHDMDHAKVQPGGVVAIYRSPQTSADSPSGYSAEPIFKPTQEPEEVYAGS